MYAEKSHKTGSIYSFSNPRGYSITALAGAFVGSAPTVAHVALRWLLRFLVLTTATVVQKPNTGQNSALLSSAYSYGIRN